MIKRKKIISDRGSIMKTAERNSNLELLRILSIFMIIFIHAFGLAQGMATDRLGSSITGIMNGVCNIGVTCFILLSGYFGIQIKWKKMIRLECMVIFYSLIQVAVTMALFPDKLQGAALLEELVKSVIPVISRKYWFYSCYVALCLFSPFLNEMIQKMKKEKLMAMLGTGLLLFSVFPTFFYFEITQDNGKGIVNMILIYCIGRAIKLHGDAEIRKGRAFLVFVVLWMINWYSNGRLPQIGGIYHTFSKDNSITNIVMAILLFYIFKSFKFQSRTINRIAVHIFSVFILNSFLLEVINGTFLTLTPEIVGGKCFFPVLASQVILTFLCAVAADRIRAWVFHIPEKAFSQWGEKKIESILKAGLWSRIGSKVKNSLIKH